MVGQYLFTTRKSLCIDRTVLIEAEDLYEAFKELQTEMKYEDFIVTHCWMQTWDYKE